MEYLIFACIIAAYGIILLFIHYNDMGEIKSAAKRKGWREIRIERSFFANLFDGNDRCYRVRYVDSEGIKHSVECKISFWHGLYWRD
ncbi:hypothetical protein RF679_16330 [Undibacterium cyanobacteriorum]|uniref:DUF3301 domain-containing protein n=1 Tax=Undibacterium cyanobacteriorum TaxID=3073561 RepID=A0ABY9RJF3_9BURK|nr:hypothetical protein [Undibacterium sp. 20NA77.5]WMW80201.1 hypothetical protein RF679_16330 [Undibacterium sp. 20NA77.5]